MATPDEHVIGIDLGTRKFCACIFHTGTRVVEVIPDDMYLCTPTHVAFTEWSYSIGRAAFTLAETDPKNIVYNPTHFLGRGPNDEDIRDIIANHPFDVLFSGDKAFFKVRYRNQDICVTPQEVLSLVLDHVKKNAEAILKGKVTRAVIVVPSSYDRVQRNLVKLAASVAGMQIVRMMTGSTACAMVHHLNAHPHLHDDQLAESSVRKIMVIDVGARSTNITLVDSRKQDLKVISTSVYKVGGEHFTEALLSLCEQPTTSVVDLSESSRMRKSRLLSECERVKCQLSDTDGPVNIDLALGPGSPSHPGVPTTREGFEGLCKVPNLTILGQIERALEESNINWKSIDEIVLAGGASKVSRVQYLVSQYFEKDPWISTELDTLAARGAAIYAGSLAPDGCSVDNFSDILRHSLGFLVSDGKLAVLLPRHTRLPCLRKTSNKLTIPNTEDSKNRQKVYAIRIYEGENEVAAKNRYLGTFRFPLALGTIGEVKIEMIFHVSSSDELTVAGTVFANGKSTVHTMTNFLGDLDLQVETTNMTKKLDQFRKDARLERALSDLSAKHGGAK